MKNVIILVLTIAVIVLSYANYSDNNIKSTHAFDPSVVSNSAIQKRTSASENALSADNQESIVKTLPLVTEDASPHNLEPIVETEPRETEGAAPQKQPSVNSLCLEVNELEQSAGCEINLALNIENEIIDAESGASDVSNVMQILKSKNFSDVLDNLSSNKSNEQSFVRETEYNNELNEYLNIHSEHVQSDGIFCGEALCAAEFKYNDINYLNNFNSNFLTTTAKGNSFLNFDLPKDQEGNNIARIVFLPENTGDVVFKK